MDKISNGALMQDTLLGISGQKSVPNIYIKKQHIGGSDKLEAKSNSGEIQKLLES